MKFHENLCSESQVIPCGRMDGQTYVMKLIIAFRSFVNTSKNEISVS